MHSKIVKNSNEGESTQIEIAIQSQVLSNYQST